MKPTKSSFLLLASTTLWLSACGSEPVGPSGPGQLEVTLHSTDTPTASAAAVVELTGPGINAVTPVDGELFVGVAGNTARVVVLPEQPGLIRFLINVDDRSMPPSTRLIEIADSENQLQSTEGYRFEFQPSAVAVELKDAR